MFFINRISNNRLFHLINTNGSQWEELVVQACITIDEWWMSSAITNLNSDADERNPAWKSMRPWSCIDGMTIVRIVIHVRVMLTSLVCWHRSARYAAGIDYCIVFFFISIEVISCRLLPTYLEIEANILGYNENYIYPELYLYSYYRFYLHLCNPNEELTESQNRHRWV